MTMISISTETERPYRQTCACCGCRIRLLGDQRCLALFLEEKSLQRRAFECMNCGGVVCQECREKNAVCACRSNAWLPRPYLDLSVIRSI